jgi:hypothetical protein
MWSGLLLGGRICGVEAFTVRVERGRADREQDVWHEANEILRLRTQDDT